MHVSRSNDNEKSSDLEIFDYWGSIGLISWNFMSHIRDNQLTDPVWIVLVFDPNVQLYLIRNSYRTINSMEFSLKHICNTIITAKNSFGYIRQYYVYKHSGQIFWSSTRFSAEWWFQLLFGRFGVSNCHPECYSMKHSTQLVVKMRLDRDLTTKSMFWAWIHFKLAGA